MSEPYPPPPPPADAGQPGPPIPYASWFQRVGGYLIDVALLLPGYLIAFAAGAMAPSTIEQARGETVSGTTIALAALGYFVIILTAFWNLIYRQGTTGYSVGKQVLGMKLIAEQTGQPLGPGMTFVRYLAHILDSLACYIGWFWPLWDAKRQTFADKLLRSVVILEKRA